ncbi:hypothetical protein EDB86DRAFT_3075103 [Lactarius hatsudake]|nr:hypothetical protein EDB86DRAFT_3075103 [Lactarius hatsudake]
MIVNWHDPARVLVDLVALIKLNHFLGGVYIWEFVLNLDFEYSILMGKRKLTWTSPPIAIFGMSFVLLVPHYHQFLAYDTPHKINCQAVIVMIFISAYLTLLFASALIALHITALWEHNKCVVAIAFTSWLANFTIYVYSTVKSRGGWTGSICVIQDTFHSNISIFSTLAYGLPPPHANVRWSVAMESSEWRHISAHGLAWVLVVTLAEIPPAVFIVLNLNARVHLGRPYEYGTSVDFDKGKLTNLVLSTPTQVFQVVGLSIMSIGASRTYRGLVDYPFSNGPPFEAAATNQLREPQRGSFGSSQQQQNYLGEGTQSAGGAKEYAHALSPDIP